MWRTAEQYRYENMKEIKCMLGMAHLGGYLPFLRGALLMV